MTWDTGIAEKIIADAPELGVALEGVDLADTYKKKRQGLAKRHGYLHLSRADVNATEPSGWSALHAAACLLNVPLVERLLELGANKSAALLADHSFAGQTFAAVATPADVAAARKTTADWQPVQSFLVDRLR